MTAEVFPLVTTFEHLPDCEFAGAPNVHGGACVCRMQGRDPAAAAYVNHGRWIADCVRRHCANAEQLTPGQTSVHCSNCLLIAPVAWPANAEAITSALAARPVPQTRNWAPAGHRQALTSGHPDGQSVQDLIDETHENEVA